MYITKPSGLFLLAVLQAGIVTATTIPVKYCGQPVTATVGLQYPCFSSQDANRFQYDDIEGASVVSRPLPSPYRGLKYAGWSAVTNINVAGVQGSVLQVQTPPTSIFFGATIGGTSTTNTFTVA